MCKKILNYLAKHPNYNGLTHFLVGAGVGILITYPLVQTHPVRWGVALVILGLLGQFYPLFISKK